MIYNVAIINLLAPRWRSVTGVLAGEDGDWDFAISSVKNISLGSGVKKMVLR